MSDQSPHNIIYCETCSQSVTCDVTTYQCIYCHLYDCHNCISHMIDISEITGLHDYSLLVCAKCQRHICPACIINSNSDLFICNSCSYAFCVDCTYDSMNQYGRNICLDCNNSDKRK